MYLSWQTRIAFIIKRIGVEDDTDVIGIFFTECVERLTGVCTGRSPEVDKLTYSYWRLSWSFCVPLRNGECDLAEFVIDFRKTFRCGILIPRGSFRQLRLGPTEPEGQNYACGKPIP